MKPLVSIIITNFNYGRYLRACIESALDQVYPNLEVILIDDASTDDSASIYNGFRGRLTIVEHEENHGIVFSRNEGLDIAKGEYITYLDADDYLDNDFVATMVEFATANDLDVTYTHHRLIDDDGRPTGKFEIYEDFDIERLKHTNFVIMGSLIKKSATAGHRFDEYLTRRSHEDWDFFLGLALDGATFGKYDEVKINYRLHGSSRNNCARTLEEKLEYVETYRYIINKYKQNYLPQLDYLNTYITDWYSELYRSYLDAKSRSLEERAVADDYRELYADSKRTIEYRVGHALLAVPRRVKGVLGIPWRP